MFILEENHYQKLMCKGGTAQEKPLTDIFHTEQNRKVLYRTFITAFLLFSHSPANIYLSRSTIKTLEKEVIYIQS